MAKKLDLVPVSEWGFFTHVFRAGIWKPRTHPGSFEGIGTEGLKWLQKVKKTYGMKVCTEVASAKHVYECIKYGIDMVWLGARTTANPFLVQEIADALEDTDIPVLVKNPVNPDLDLWIGALERLNRSGVRKLGVIHRGFSTSEKQAYRNEPGWKIAIELRTRYPEMPFFADPSHMGGKREYLLELSQRAMDLGLEGLMIESHCNPAAALSDAAQQLTPDGLRELLECGLKVRDNDTDSQDYRDGIVQLRAQIDIIDENLLYAFSTRMGVSEKIGRYKKEHPPDLPLGQRPRRHARARRRLRPFGRIHHDRLHGHPRGVRPQAERNPLPTALTRGKGIERATGHVVVSMR